MRLSLALWAAATLACAPGAPGGAGADGDADVDAALFLRTPRALLECAAPPDDMEARLWVSGSAEPCPLEVDVAAGTTSGFCTTAPGLARTLTLDWFAPRGGIDLVLAQARGGVDLSASDEEQVAFTVGEDDVVTSECLDMTEDQVDGTPIIEVNGAGVPVCDVDDSCAGGDGACSNLGELCADTDPFDAGDEP